MSRGIVDIYYRCRYIGAVGYRPDTLASWLIDRALDIRADKMKTTTRTASTSAVFQIGRSAKLDDQVIYKFEAQYLEF